MSINEKTQSIELLYHISKAMAAVKDGRELLKIIIENAQPIFGFYDIGLSVLNKSGEFYVDWSVFYEDINPSEANFEQRSLGKFTFPADEPLLVYAVERFAAEGKPFILCLDAEFIERFPDFPHLEVEIKHGYKQFLAATLQFGGETLGVLNFNGLRENQFDDCDFELFQAIADLVAVAVANITANEEIIEREREKSVLLSISQAIATIQNHEQLFKVIFERIQPVFGFHDVGLFVLSKDGERVTDWAVASEQINPSNGNRQLKNFEMESLAVKESPLPIVIERLANADAPLIFSYSDEYVNSVTDSKFREKLKTIIENGGYQEFLATILKSGGKTLGVLFFNSKQKVFFQAKQFNLFQSFADQIAVAVANITANEEILERTHEKSVLLSISSDIASARNAVELLQVIREKAQQLIPFYDTGILIVEPDGEHHYDLAVNLPGWDNSESNRKLHALGLHRITHPNSYLEYVMRLIETSEKPIIENYPARTLEFDHPFFATLLETGYQEGLGAALKSGGKTFGTFWLNSLEKNHFKPAQFEIFQALADQVAVAVSNILANEEIVEREQEKTKLLSISREIAKVQTRRQLLDVIFNTIKSIFPYDDAGLFYFCDRDGAPNPNGDCHVHLLDDLISEVNFELTENGLTGILSEGTDVVRFAATEKPQALSLTELMRAVPEHPHYPVMEQLGIKQLITIGIKSGGAIIGMLCFNSCRADFYGAKDFALFENIANQVAVAVSNILAGDEIKRQLAEIKELKKRLEAENIYLNEEIGKNYNFDEIIGTSPKLHQVFEVIEQVAPTDATVLIQGETGTGKELVARAIHNRSTRNERPLIKVNCAALPRELVESELFGHERGSFTGAIERRIGKFELASGGTIFLDEIGELPLEMQVKLLRVLQEKEIERLGGKGVIKLDLRVVAATNRNLAQEVQAGRFRADLYYRLCTVELFMPNLRERREDIEPLTMSFAEKYAAKFSRKIERISSKMLAELRAYDFPGNIRELEHIVEHAVIFSKNEKLILPRSLAGNTPNAEIISTAEPKASPPNKPAADDSQSLQTIEREHIVRVLDQTSGRIKGKRGAAEILGLNPATVYFRMKKLGIERGRI